MKFYDEEPRLVDLDAAKRAPRFPNIHVFQGQLRPDTWTWADEPGVVLVDPPYDPKAGLRCTLIYADEPETYRIFSDSREKE